MVVGASVAIGSVLVLVVVGAAVVYAVAFIAARGAKRGGRD